jgi:hypothetical protein
MDVDPTAGTKNTEDLTHHFLRLVAVVENTVRIDVIKTFIFKRKMPHVGLKDDRAVAQALAGQLYMSRSQIYASRDGPVLGKLQQVGSGSTADFEHLVSCMFAKLCHIVEPGICGVALLLGWKQGRLVPVSLGKLCCVRHHLHPAKECVPIRLLHTVLQNYCVATRDSV